MDNKYLINGEGSTGSIRTLRKEINVMETHVYMWVGGALQLGWPERTLTQILNDEKWFDPSNLNEYIWIPFYLTSYWDFWDTEIAAKFKTTYKLCLQTNGACGKYS